MITPLYDFGGRYRGFVAGDTVYDRSGRPLGIVEDRNVFNSHGELVGELRGQSIVVPGTASGSKRTQPTEGRVSRLLTRLFERVGSSVEPFDLLEQSSS